MIKRGTEKIIDNFKIDSEKGLEDNALNHLKVYLLAIELYNKGLRYKDLEFDKC